VRTAGSEVAITDMVYALVHYLAVDAQHINELRRKAEITRLHDELYTGLLTPFHKRSERRSGPDTQNDVRIEGVITGLHERNKPDARQMAELVEQAQADGISRWRK